MAELIFSFINFTDRFNKNRFLAIILITFLISSSFSLPLAFSDEAVQVRLKVNVLSVADATKADKQKIMEMVTETNLIFKQCKLEINKKIELTFDKVKDYTSGVMVKDPDDSTMNLDGPFNVAETGKLLLQGLKEIKFDAATKKSNGYKLFIIPEFSGDAADALGYTTVGYPVSVIEDSVQGLEGVVLAHEFVHGKNQRHKLDENNLMSEFKPSPSPTTEEIKKREKGKLDLVQCDRIFERAIKEGPKDQTPEQKPKVVRNSYSFEHSFFSNISTDSITDSSFEENNLAIGEISASIPLDTLDFRVTLWQFIPTQLVELEYLISIDSDNNPGTGELSGNLPGADLAVHILASGEFPFTNCNISGVIPDCLAAFLEKLPSGQIDQLDDPVFEGIDMLGFRKGPGPELREPVWDNFEVKVPALLIGSLGSIINVEYASLDNMGNILDSLLVPDISTEPVVFPTLTMEPDSLGFPGTSLTLIGDGFTPNSDVRILFDHNEIGVSTTNLFGQFTDDIVVPLGTEPGDFFIDVFDDVSDLPGLALYTVLDSIIVGGVFSPIDTTAVLLAGAYSTAAWMIPAIIAAIGIGIVIARKF